jgi:hypothetical protein
MIKNSPSFKRQINLTKPLIVLATLIIWSNTNSLFAQNWNQIIKTVASDRGSDDNFGYSVDISGDYAIVSARFEDEDEVGGNTLIDPGAAYIFKNNGGTWSEIQKIVASDRTSVDYFGISVAISGDYAIVGASSEDQDANGGNTVNNAGAAYIFKNNAGTWSEVQKIVSSYRGTSYLFGGSVDISGDYAIVGSFGDKQDSTGLNILDNAGAAYIFKNDAGTWIEVKKLVNLDRETGDNYGISVGISGDYAIVSARYEDEDANGGNTINGAGSAYIYKNNTGIWSHVQKIVASDRESGDLFGTSLDISGDYAIVGVELDEHDLTGGNMLERAGSAYIFKNNAGTWSEVQKIVASDRDDFDFFGKSVAISADYAIVGANGEDQDANGGNTQSSAGSAYVFENIAGTWSEVQKIVTSDRAVLDNFGTSVAISGDYAILSAPFEEQDANGGNTISEAGSAYIFKNSCLAPSGTDVQVACNSYTWIDGTTYTLSNNTATHSVINSAGCDSMVLLNLTINNVSNNTTTSGPAISANNANANYQWLNCDNAYAIIAGETGQTFTATINGNYAVELSENGCVDTSACVAINTVGIIENSFGNDLFLYPNPTNGNFSIDLGDMFETMEVRITDLSGKLINSKTILHSQVLSLSIDEPAGIYFVSVQAVDKKVIFKLIKD